MLLDIFSSIITTVGSWSVAIGGLTTIAIISLALLLVVIVISVVSTQFAIEVVTTKAINRVNKYLALNPLITDDNLVEFNTLMKHIPPSLRKEWQQYMVSRENKPSDYFTESNCIDKPFKASSYGTHLTATRTAVFVIALIAMLFTSTYFAAIDGALSFTNLVASLVLSGLIVAVGEIFLTIQKSRRNKLTANIYSSFAAFQKYMDKAVTTLPEVVDYEILFTRKEIVADIPVLQEYLHQRALLEQEQIKRAAESQVVHEKYDFSALGINGSLVMEKAMQVSEQFIGNKNGVRLEIAELESQRDLLEKNYDDKTKTNQRKLRDIQETLDRLKEKLDATTNLIVGNDLRKQRENEIQKQRQIEKEAQEDNRKFEEEKKKINAQIDEKRQEIEEDRKRAEDSLNSEFKSYADKIYEELRAMVEEQHKEELEKYNEENSKLQQEIEERDRAIVEKSTLYDELLEEVDDYKIQVKAKDDQIAQQEERLAQVDLMEDQKNQEIFEIKREIESRKLEILKKDEQITRKDEIISRKDEQITNQRSYIDELKRKRKQFGDEIYADEDGKMYYIDSTGTKNYVTSNDEDLSSEVVEGKDESGNTEKVRIKRSFRATDSESRKYQDALYGDEEQSPYNSFAWGNSNISREDAEEEEDDYVYLKKPESSSEEKHFDIKEPEAEQIPQPIEPQELEEEAHEEIHQEPLEVEEEPEQEPAKQLSQEEEEDILSELDKLIEEQNAELDKQNKNLSKQLEETQKVAEEEPKPKAKPKEKPASKAKSAKAKSEKKPAPKKSKASAKPKKEEPKAKPAKAKSKKAEADSSFLDLDLEQFNEQLKSMLDDIDNGDEGKK